MGLLNSDSAELKILGYFLKKMCISSFNSHDEMPVRDYRLMGKKIGAVIVPASCSGVL